MRYSLDYRHSRTEISLIVIYCVFSDCLKVEGLLGGARLVVAERRVRVAKFRYDHGH